MVLKPGEIIRIAVSLVRKHLQSKYTQSANKLIKEHHYCIVFYDDMSPQYSIALPLLFAFADLYHLQVHGKPLLLSSVVMSIL